MKIKLDENLPERLGHILSKLGYDTDTAAQEGLSGQQDGKIWKAAQDTKRFLITQDLDFSDPGRIRASWWYVLETLVVVLCSVEFSLYLRQN